jgi:hypothetical protein
VGHPRYRRSRNILFESQRLLQYTSWRDSILVLEMVGRDGQLCLLIPEGESFIPIFPDASKTFLLSYSDRTGDCTFTKARARARPALTEEESVAVERHDDSRRTRLRQTPAVKGDCHSLPTAHDRLFLLFSLCPLVPCLRSPLCPPLQPSMIHLVLQPQCHQIPQQTQLSSSDELPSPVASSNVESSMRGRHPPDLYRDLLLPHLLYLLIMARKNRHRRPRLPSNLPLLCLPELQHRPRLSRPVPHQVLFSVMVLVELLLGPLWMTTPPCGKRVRSATTRTRHSVLSRSRFLRQSRSRRRYTRTSGWKPVVLFILPLLASCHGHHP